MAGPFGISSLLALAIVRRLLLELNVSEGQDLGCVFAHSLEVWVTQPVDDFDGRSPAEVLAASGGDDVVRSWLRKQLRL